MRTILIADDEPLIVTGLSQKVDWAQLGCRVVGTASNGLAAMKLLDELDPDILLTDIVMPGATGLELAAYVKEKRRRTRIILLSTYDHFDYAREGIRMGVCDYILKPIDLDKLREAVEKASEELDAQERRSADSPAPAAAHSPIGRDQLFELAGCGLCASAAEEQLRQLFPRGIVLCMQAFNEPADSNLAVLRALRQGMIAALRERGLRDFSRFDRHVVMFLIPVDSPSSLIELHGCARRVVRQTPCSPGMVCVAAASPEIFPFEELHQAYLACLGQLRQAWFATESGLWKPVPIRTVIVQQELDEVRSALVNGSLTHLTEAFNALRDRLVEGHDPEHAAHTLREVHRLATASASLSGMVEKPAFDVNMQGDSFARVCRHVYQYLVDICQFISQSKHVAGRLRLMMRDNFTRPDFNQAQAASIMGVSPSYLSRLFKKEMGQNFQEMLVSMRLNKACELLTETALKHCDIARQVGFEDERYFSQVFRRYTGLTPGQYRAQGKNPPQEGQNIPRLHSDKLH